MMKEKKQNHSKKIVALVIIIIVILILGVIVFAILNKDKELLKKDENKKIETSSSNDGIDTTWQNNVNYILDENNKTLTLKEKELSNPDVYKGDVVIKKFAIIDGVEYETRFPNYCSNLFYQTEMTSFSMEDIDTSNVNGIDSMFMGCFSLQKIDLSNFDTSNVIDMDQAFYECTQLKSLDLSSFDVENVTSMLSMFSGGFNADLNLSGWKIGRKDVVNNTSYGFALVFFGNQSKNIIAKNWDLSSAGDLTGMFAGCSKLETLDISGWNLGTEIVAHSFFDDCTSLKNIKGIDEWRLSNFNLDSYPFATICHNCTSLDNKLTGGIWNKGTWSDGTFIPLI
ncbi:MAG: BspA family leucine-rich repeat surface protein [Clostridia bacterium]|nr:BspA family leucine-rich repeat surface protein [Clostridia bacterium]